MEVDDGRLRSEWQAILGTQWEITEGVVIADGMTGVLGEGFVGR